MRTVTVPAMYNPSPATSSETLPVNTRTAMSESRFWWTKWIRPVDGQ
jgi:hypothetical protein